MTHPEDLAAFQRCLAAKFRWWLAGLPAGIGLATLRATLKLWLGFPPDRSGVASAGNGPAMRSAIIGAYFANEPAKLKEFVLASTRITHTDPKAATGALAIARAVAWETQGSGPVEMFLARLRDEANDREWSSLLEKLEQAHRDRKSVAEFAAKLGLQQGVTGYVYHTVPMALFAWAHHRGDFVAGLQAVLDCGGDTDTTGSITGALLGAGVGASGIPIGLCNAVCDWPRSCAVVESAARRLAEQSIAGKPLGPVRYFWPGLLPRNLAFLLVVLFHGFRHLAPPY